MFEFLFNLLNKLILNLLYLLRIKKYIQPPEPKTTEPNMIFINIFYSIKNLKLNGNLKICVNKDSKIEDAKQIIVDEINKILAQKFNNQIDQLKRDQIAVILAGQQLDDESIIANYDLGQNSLINVVKITDKPNSQTDQYYQQSALLLTTNDDQLEKDQRELDELKKDDFVCINKDGNEELAKPTKLTKKSYFFVYCSSKSCKKITNGKLRVFCSECKEHTLIIDQGGPKSWEDVLVKERVKGRCQNFKCNKSNNQDKWAIFYFKCADDDHRNNNEENEQSNKVTKSLDEEKALPLESIKHNTRSIPCSICDEVKDLIFLFSCTHLICLDCFKFYCESKLNSRELDLVENIGYTLNCVFDCSNSYIENTHYFHVLSDHDYSRYQDFAVEEYIAKNNGIICPQPNCSQGMLIDQNVNCKKICCVNCEFVFCKSCKLEYHDGECSTDIYLESIKINQTNQNQVKSFAELIKDKINMFGNWGTNVPEVKKPEIKNCPKCKTPTERDSGCVHVQCKICNLNWCFICVAEFSYDCMSNHWFE